jgi:hypothetical protein
MTLAYAAIVRQRRISNRAGALTAELLVGPGAIAPEVRTERYANLRSMSITIV